MPSRLERLDTGRKLVGPDGLVDEIYQLSEGWPGIVEKPDSDPLKHLVTLIEFYPETNESAPALEEDEDGNEVESTTMVSTSTPAHYVVWRAPSALLAVIYGPLLGGQVPESAEELIATVRNPWILKDENGQGEVQPPERAFCRRIWLTPSAVRSDDQSFDLEEARKIITEKLREIHEAEEAEAEDVVAAQPAGNGAAAQPQP